MGDIFKEYEQLERDYYNRKRKEWEDIENSCIDKIVDKVNLILSTQSVVDPKKTKIERYLLENIIKECIHEIHSYTCNEMIDID